MKYIPVIGLEVHVELKTTSKMFCSCSADYFGAKPNTHTCPVCLGLPGALPVPNKKAIEWCIMIAQALNCQINTVSKFDRKNYFYPDLSKGFQISQYDQPFGETGWIDLAGSTPCLPAGRSHVAGGKDNHEPPATSHKRIGITRVHMEEDTGKLTHEGGTSLIDFNRSGVPLVEIVTEPDFESAEEVVEYLKKLQQIVRYLGVSNADMEKGDMRLEPNISLRDANKPFDKAHLPNYKVEVKNINSFSFVSKAIAYELKRQAALLDKGETPPQETRGFNESGNNTVSQRSKENAHDYRYFPEPDIPPVLFTTQQIETIKSTMPELPDAKLARFQKAFSLSAYDAEILIRDTLMANYFEETVEKGRSDGISPKQIANMIINKKITPENTSVLDLIRMIQQASQKDEISEDELSQAIGAIIKENEKPVAEYKAGKETVLMFLLGVTMRKIGKKVDATKVKEALINALK